MALVAVPMKKPLFWLLVLACSAAPCRAAELHLSIQNGMVSVDAQDVTIRQILTEWARIGQTRIVNIERLGQTQVTLKFDGVPEKQALDILLRAVPGYMAAPREAFLANASIYDTIVIMATTTSVAAIRPPPARPGGPPGAATGITQLRQLQPVPPQVVIQDPDDDPMDDPALAAAAAAGLIPVPAPSPGQISVATPLMMPGGGVPPPPTASEPPVVPTPSNPWNAPPGTSMPGLATPPAPATVQPPVLLPRPPQADR